jgi:antitoxin component of RelBE/YafQ-DinJ toxin-antitoxin module
MVLNQELQAKIEAGKVFEALTIAISEAIELEITTCIDSSDLDEIKPSASDNLLRTRLNLLDGTVDHEIDLKLVDNPAYPELQRWHIEQVKQKQNSIIKNLASLEKLRHVFLGRGVS